MADQNLVPIGFRHQLAKQFRDGFGRGADPTRMYLVIGKVTNYSTAGTPDPVANTVETVYYTVPRSLIAAKRVYSSDVTLVVDRKDWSNNTVFDEYHSNTVNLHGNNDFYVYTSNRDVYKVINNNFGASSTVEPTGTTTTLITTSDGYVWKYMYSVSSADENKFVSNTYIPVQTLQSDDSSQQYDVQQAAVKGAITSIRIANTGAGYIQTTGNVISAPANNQVTLNSLDVSSSSNLYDNSAIFISSGTGSGQLREIQGWNGVSYTVTTKSDFTINPDSTSKFHIAPFVKIDGNGSAAQAYANVVSGKIQNITMVTDGKDYSYANVELIKGDSASGGGAVLEIDYTPQSGHGGDPELELGAKDLMLDVRLFGIGQNTALKFSTNNDFRMYGLVVDPNLTNSSNADAITYDLTTRLNITSAAGVWSDDEKVVGQTSNTYGYLVGFQGTNVGNTAGTVSLVSTSGDFISGEVIKGETSNANGAISGITKPDFDAFSGDLIYLRSQEAIERDKDQIENIKVVINF